MKVTSEGSEDIEAKVLDHERTQLFCRLSVCSNDLGKLAEKSLSLNLRSMVQPGHHIGFLEELQEVFSSLTECVHTLPQLLGFVQRLLHENPEAKSLILL